MKLALVPLALLVLGATAQPKCGNTPVKPKLDNCDQNKDEKIVGGCEATPYSWPWQIGFCQNYLGALSLICGGSIVDNQWIVTAGHCVYGNEDSPNQFRVKLGVFDHNNKNETGEVVAEVEKIYLHPKFNMQTIEWDISILKLKKPVTFSDHIQPVCLPTKDDDVIKKGNSCWVTGWGTLHEGDFGLPRKLHQVIVPYLDQSACDKEYGASNINDDCMFCAGRTGEDSCQGDSGGPVVTQGKDGRWWHYGIVSWGYGCAEAGHAGVYSRTTAYCDFIEQTIGKKMCQTHS